MSKSLGNYVSLENVLEKNSSDAFRYFYISTHYRRPLNFTWKALENAENTTKRLENTLTLIDNAMRTPEEKINFEMQEELLLSKVKQAKTAFIEAMDDDFNTPIALVHLHNIRDAINEYLIGPSNKGVLTVAAQHYKELLGVLGLFENRYQSTDKLTKDLIKIIVNLRQKQRKLTNYELADEIRDKLAAIGIDIQDTKEGVSWKIST
jgi:cysteinyl-tRNA synthetase